MLVLATFLSLLSLSSTVLAVTCNTKVATDSIVTQSAASATTLGCLTIEYCAESATGKTEPCNETNAYTILQALPPSLTCLQAEAHAIESDVETGHKTTCCDKDLCNVEHSAEIATVAVSHGTPTEALVNGTSSTASTATSSPTSGAETLFAASGFAAIVAVVAML